MANNRSEICHMYIGITEKQRKKKEKESQSHKQIHVT